jgi:hypothetical protein
MNKTGLHYFKYEDVTPYRKLDSVIKVTYEFELE